MEIAWLDSALQLSHSLIAPTVRRHRKTLAIKVHKSLPMGLESHIFCDQAKNIKNHIAFVDVKGTDNEVMEFYK